MTENLTATISQVNEAVQNMAQMSRESSQNSNEIQENVYESVVPWSRYLKQRRIKQNWLKGLIS